MEIVILRKLWMLNYTFGKGYTLHKLGEKVREPIE